VKEALAKEGRGAGRKEVIVSIFRLRDDWIEVGLKRCERGREGRVKVDTRCMG